MTNLSKSLDSLIHNMTWEKEWFEEDVTDKELNQLATLAKLIQNKYNQTEEKKTLLGMFKQSNYSYLQEIDKERNESVYVAKTTTGQPILYARFEEDYKINPTKASDYLNQYK